jgi:hypothetical protein
MPMKFNCIPFPKYALKQIISIRFFTYSPYVALVIVIAKIVAHNYLIIVVGSTMQYWTHVYHF